MQTTIDWHYLPGQPPEPERVHDIEHYLVDDGNSVHEGWYEGKGEWSFWGGGKVCAWATWPEAPPVDEPQTPPSHEIGDLIRLGPWFGRITSLLTCDTTGEKFARVKLAKHRAGITEIHSLNDFAAATMEQVHQAIDAMRTQQEATWAAVWKDSIHTARMMTK